MLRTTASVASAAKTCVGAAAKKRARVGEALCGDGLMYRDRLPAVEPIEHIAVTAVSSWNHHLAIDELGTAPSCGTAEVFINNMDSDQCFALRHLLHQQPRHVLVQQPRKG